MIIKGLKIALTMKESRKICVLLRSDRPSIAKILQRGNTFTSTKKHEHVRAEQYRRAHQLRRHIMFIR